ncbi:hypothetical protein Ahy_B02g061533 [Arachis hypogaea]|uniref:Uncharacterized protein n=1 Tax=Arachis hypogaea TaxID=3818 RepID=A0A445AL73_ARAHY|nr:hypothetical protein Ahy_B02g061533 [Arachis hypogaea]
MQVAIADVDPTTQNNWSKSKWLTGSCRAPSVEPLLGHRSQLLGRTWCPSSLSLQPRFRNRRFFAVQMEVSLSDGNGELLGTDNEADVESNPKDMCGQHVADEDLGEYENVARLDVEDIKRMHWDSVDAAYEFYRRLGMCHGFGVRKGDSGKDCSGNLIRYRFFCNKKGLKDGRHNDQVDRRRAHKPETRTNCEAKLSIYFDKTERCWKVRKVVTEHNHDLTPASMVHLIANHREMTDATKAQIDGLRASGIATSKIVGYMAGMAGGYSLLGFLKKDVYNYTDRTRCANISNGDANAAVVYLEGKAGSNPMSVARYSVTKEETLTNLIWADGARRVDYQHFGDVLAFDSTYKKNKYKKPLVIFSGSNNHKQTTIFGFGLLFDECQFLQVDVRKSA